MSVLHMSKYWGTLIFHNSNLSQDYGSESVVIHDQWTVILKPMQSKFSCRTVLKCVYEKTTISRCFFEKNLTTKFYIARILKYCSSDSELQQIYVGLAHYSGCELSACLFF